MWNISDVTCKPRIEDENKLTKMREVFPPKKLTSKSFDNDNKLTLKSFFAFCSVFFTLKDQRRKDGNDFETDTVSGSQNTPGLKLTVLLVLMEYIFLTWQICFQFLGDPLLCAIIYVSQ